MKLKYLLAASVVSLSASAMVAVPGVAQEVTSAIQGTVTTETGDPVPGAEVVVTDTRTGRSSTVTTSSNGGFSVRSLEVGGPFTVVANAPGYQAERAEGLTVGLSGATSLRFELASQTSGNDEIVVTAQSITTSPRALGPGSSFGLDVLEEQPSLSRDIRDVIQTDPRVILDSSFPDSTSNRGTVSCLGASTRVNSLTVDGVRQDDGFGLNDSGFPSESQPFPFEALSAVSVEFAPFDVQYGLFSGCNINVVTKSGTNEFHGGAFGFYNSDSLVGDTVDGITVNLGDFETKKYGAYIGGPIIEDRLFFHVTYDREDGSQGLDDGPAGSGAANEATDITQEEIAEVQQILNDVYGFEPGGILASIPRDTERLFVRLDANITDEHRVAFNYQRTREDFVTPQNTNGRFNELGLASNYYQSGNSIDSYSLRLFSNWSDNFSTEVRVSRIENEDQQDSLLGTDFQQFEVETPSGGSIFLGPDSFRQANELSTTTDQVKVAGFLSAGNHTFTVGAEYDRFDVFNLFIQDGNGSALFRNDDDLATGLSGFDRLRAGTPSEFDFRSPISGNQDDAAAIYEREIYSVYLQDEWLATPDLTLQLGLRYDFYNGDSRPVANPIFANRYGFTNSTGFDKLDVLQPRFGFRYQLGDFAGGFTTLRGGVGVFSGGDPSVIFANSYTNNGITLDDVNERDFAPGFTTDGFSPPTGAADLLRAGDGEVNAVDPDFEIPKFLRANFGVDHEFNAGWRLVADYIYSKAYDPLFVQDLTLAQTGTAPDGRPLYRQVDFADPDCATNPGDSSACTGRFTSDYLLTNGEGGRSHVASVSLSKRWDQETGFLGLGGDFLIAYSYQDATEIQPLTSSRAVSNFGNFSKIDVNNPEAFRSNAGRAHNAIARLNLEKDFFGENTSELTFFLKYRTGQPYSVNFDTSVARGQFCSNATGINPFGDSRCFEDRVLLYVPAVDDSIVTYADGFDLDAFNSFIAENGLEEFRGKIVDRNAFQSDDYWDLDLRFSQELPGFFGSDRFKFIFDLENALNLIDSDWNTLRQVGFEYNLPTVGAEIDSDTGNYVFTSFDDPRNDAGEIDQSVATSASVWQIQFGLTYEF